MNLRDKERFDYATYDKKGLKVPKVVTEEYAVKMADDLIRKEKGLREDLAHTLDIYAIADAVTTDELDEGIAQISLLAKEFRSVHVDLREVLQDSYCDKYPGYQKNLNTLTDFIKESRKRKRLLLDLKGAILPDIDTIVVEENSLSHKVAQLDRSMRSPQLASNIPELKRFISLMESYSGEYVDLLHKYRLVARPCEGDELLKLFEEKSGVISDEIKISKVLLHKLLEVTEYKKADDLEKIERANHILTAESVNSEICVRLETLDIIYQQDLESLGDYQILQITQKDNHETEFKEILSKITELTGLVPKGGKKVREMLDLVTIKKNATLERRKRFGDSLRKIVLDRDITPDKLRNACSVKIDNFKFGGYESSMDFYTFKTQFQKLIEHRHQKPFLAEVLKRNYLSGSALKLVEKEDDYNKIWERLKESYGNTRLMLHNKLGVLDKIGGLASVKGDEKIVTVLASLTNAMSDLSSLAEKHGLEGQLYEGGALEKVIHLIGRDRQRRFRKENLDFAGSKKEEWVKLFDYLKIELKLHETFVSDAKSAQLLNLNSRPDKRDPPANNVHLAGNLVGVKCPLCDKLDHVVVETRKGNKIIPYYLCEAFAKASPAERRSTLELKGFCKACLFPGAKKGPPHKCRFTNFCCPCSHSEKIHVLLCSDHKSDPNHVATLQKFKEKFVLNNSSFPNFTKNIACFSNIVAIAKISMDWGPLNPIPDITDCAIYPLQRIEITGIVTDGDTTRVVRFVLNIFYDGGCGGMIVSESAVEMLTVLGRAKQLESGPIIVRGVADQKSICEKGSFMICLPLFDGTDVEMSGLCIPKITQAMPDYRLTDVEADLRKECEKSGTPDLLDRLPNLPEVVGGETHILLGSQYRRYFPKHVFEMESGLTLQESVFSSPCGSRGVVTGPHPAFTIAERQCHSAYRAEGRFTEDYKVIRDHYRLLSEACMMLDKPVLENGDVDAPICCSLVEDIHPDVGQTCCGSSEEDVYVGQRVPKCVKKFEELENSGTEVLYRCSDCRNCARCKQGPRIEDVSIEQEFEQSVIEKVVMVDPVTRRCSAKLPFVVPNPDNRLVDNEYDAVKAFKSQVRRLSKRPDEKKSVVESEAKLQNLGFVDYVSNLTSEQQRKIFDACLRNFLIWLVVFNENSLSTPTRLVFDASRSTSCGGPSLNSLLAKGINSMNKFIDIELRWATHKHAFHSDISKMYNRVQLEEDHWRYQLYLWSDGLDERAEPRWKVMMTHIYGVVSSGNIAECALRRVVEMNKDAFPRAFSAVTYDTYVDDCKSGTNSPDDTLKVMEEIDCSIGTGGFTNKGYTVSGKDPPADLSSDGESVTVGGMKWFPKGDFLRLNIGPLNFNRKCRGRKSMKDIGAIPQRLSKRDCASILAGVFDPRGLAAPIIASMKDDISILHKRALDWEEPLPAELREIWVSNFGLIEELGEVRFQRAVVPDDAVSLDITTIDTADATENLICSAIYARFKVKSGDYSCQLMFARSKIVHDLTIPRAELAAALINATTGFVVQRSLKEMYKGGVKVTDSQVALHWINCGRGVLKLWVRNRVIEILRLSPQADWFYVRSRDNIADLGSRKGAKIVDIGPDSPWINGYEWMRKAPDDFPLLSVDQIVLSRKEKAAADIEMMIVDSTDVARCFLTRYVPQDVGKRFKYSQYLVNPIRFRFRTVLRIVALVFIFVQKVSRKLRERTGRSFDFMRKREFSVRDTSSGKGNFVVSAIDCVACPTIGNKTFFAYISEDMLSRAKAYFFVKASKELKHFVDPRKYKDDSVMQDGILYHTSRILSDQVVDDKIGLSDVCLDLKASTFCVPIIDAKSPVAYAIVSETHWYDPDVRHGGVESVLRYAQMIAYIIGGRELVKSFQKACARCRLLHKRRVQAAMGPVSPDNLNIAPAFYTCQVDLCGPFPAYSPANKRATLKVWFVVLCCSVTGAVDCRIMEDYSTDAFLLAFIRFSCRFGYPKSLNIDEGSQLLKGCKDMVISFIDLQHRLSVEYGIDFKTCPVGAHYVHGKVERKIQDIKKSFALIEKNRLSIIQWESLGQQVANGINNMPIALGNKVECLESLDILTPNRLILGRNNSRCPAEPLEVRDDLRRIIESNREIYEVWFKEWLVSCVPTLVEKPKWFITERNICVGDIVLFLKSEQEFDLHYQYGIVIATYEGKDGIVRVVEVEYQNASENVKRTTKRGVRDLVVIHEADEIGISSELDQLCHCTHISY